MGKKFYLTTPIFYVNASPHVGHAYAMVLADIIARFHRTVSEETYFLTGTDEHGIKNLRSAEAAGKGTQEFVDEKAEEFRKLAALVGASYDQFIRTSDRARHWPGAVALWKNLAAAGDIYEGTYEGLYCVGCETFKTEKELVDGRCPDHNAIPQKISQENYFFRLSKYTEKIKAAIESNELEIVPASRKNEILAVLADGLEDVSFSRPAKDLPWGIPVPGDPSQTMYVWCDALANYVSALGYGRDDDTLFKKFWPADVHLIGKDILRFHAAIWPAMLFSARLPLPKKLLVHGLLLSGGKKMSKTIGNTIDPVLLVNEYGAEAFRFYLAHEVNPFEDGDITEEKFKEVYNTHLANGLGNLVSRVMKMASSYLSTPVVPSSSLGSKVVREYHAAMERCEVNRAAGIVWNYIRDLDHEIQETEPFKLVKTDPERAKKIVTGLVGGVALVGRLVAPFLPETAEKILAAVKENKMPPPLFARLDSSPARQAR